MSGDLAASLATDWPLLRMQSVSRLARGHMHRPFASHGGLSTRGHYGASPKRNIHKCLPSGWQLQSKFGPRPQRQANNAFTGLTWRIRKSRFIRKGRVFWKGGFTCTGRFIRKLNILSVYAMSLSQNRGTAFERHALGEHRKAIGSATSSCFGSPMRASVYLSTLFAYGFDIGVGAVSPCRDKGSQRSS